MPDLCEKPLLTFAVCAFRQERFIQETVAAAFAQTYSPLEIILSDDCSEDRTFDIMRKMAASYKGPHRLVLNRNPVRMSIGGHINRIVELSHGEMIVGAAGDDVSLPQRTQVICDAWEQSGRRATSIHSNYIQIDDKGQVIEKIFKSEGPIKAGQMAEQRVCFVDFVKTRDPCVFGCTHAFSPRLFQTFGNLPAQVIHEDEVLALRTVLAGQLFYVNEPLVKYRLHDNNVCVRSGQRGRNLKSLQQQEDRMRFDFRNRETMHDAFLLDLERAKQLGLIERVDFEKAAAEAARLRRHFALMGKFLESGIIGKLRILSTLRREGLDGEEFRILVRRLVPGPLLLRIRLARSYAALAWNRAT